ncbi:MAG: hypothetical protein A2W68_09150 [Betaproteobacteria bacterium RIFCSPLOWO2_02_64_14]|nr:MAG: hypothetical protein A2W68_09150 [Betaproteobacteria bacterium RIFCSPLOWO2_02_64_14]
MHVSDLSSWQHAHIFGQDRKRPGEVRTLIVIGITSIMMVVEIATGILFGSMALLADSLQRQTSAILLDRQVEESARRKIRGHSPSKAAGILQTTASVRSRPGAHYCRSAFMSFRGGFELRGRHRDSHRLKQQQPVAGYFAGREPGVLMQQSCAKTQPMI